MEASAVDFRAAADSRAAAAAAADTRPEGGRTTAGTTDDNHTADPRPAKRVSHTCVPCRVRKVRCDGRRDVCSNCERLGFSCSFDDSGDGGGGGGGGGLGAHTETSFGLGSSYSAPPLPSSSDSTDLRDAHAIPRRRARQACHNCHVRKARCSGSLPQCDRCRALGIECVYRPGKRSRLSPGAGTATGGGTDGFSHSRSDSADLAADMAVSNRGGASVTMIGGGGGGAVGPVLGAPSLAAGVSSLTSGATGTPRPPALSAIPPGASSGLTSHIPANNLESMAARTFDLFFRHIHHIPTFAFLHRASLMQRYRAGLVDRPLLLALVGITSLMTDLGPGTPELGRQCMAEAEALVLRRLERPSTLALQTLVFIVHHRILSCRFSSAFMLHGLASRFAVALRLHHENPRLCFLARESRRRLMWALYMVDASMANGFPDLGLWVGRPEEITGLDIQLPCNERNFEFDLPEKSERLQPPPPVVGPDGSGGVLQPPPLPDNMGFLALHVRIRALRSRILEFTKREVAAATASIAAATAGTPHATPTATIASPDAAASATDTSIATLPARCTEFADELAAFAARLPASFRWSEGNARLRTYSPRLCVFLMTHVWWEQCHCELFRFVLPGLQEALPAPLIAQLEEQCPAFVQHCRRQIWEHTRSMADMFRLLLTLDNGVPVTDLDLPICLYQCARLLSYMGRSGGMAGLAGDGMASTNATSTPTMDSTAAANETATSHETFLDLTGLCLRVLEHCTKTPASLRIKANLERLMANDMAVSPKRSAAATANDMDLDDMESDMFQGSMSSAAPASGTTGIIAATGLGPSAVPTLVGASTSSQQLSHQHQAQTTLSRETGAVYETQMLDILGNHVGSGFSSGSGGGGIGFDGAGGGGGPDNNIGFTPVGSSTVMATTLPAVSTPSSVLAPTQTPPSVSGPPDAPPVVDAFDLDVGGLLEADFADWFSGGEWPSEVLPS